MIIVKKTRVPIMDKMELHWVLLDTDKQNIIAYFYDEQQASIATDALNTAETGMSPMQEWSVRMCNELCR